MEQQKTINLIRLYKKKEALWNMHSPLYKKLDARQQAYEEIAQIMNMSCDQVKKKIRSIRTVYVSEKTRFEHKKQSGTITGKINKPKLAWYDEMAFLDEFIVPRKINNDLKQQTGKCITAYEEFLKKDTPSLEQIEHGDESLLSPKIEECDSDYECDTSVKRTKILIKLYREREMLWNMHCPLYKKVEPRQKAYCEIAKILKISVDEAKKRIRSLRTVYVAEKTKVENSKQSGCAADKVYKPNIDWYGEMAFLDNCIIPRKIKNEFKQNTDVSLLFEEPLSLEQIYKCDEPSVSSNEESDDKELIKTTVNITTDEENLSYLSAEETGESITEILLEENEHYKMRCGEIYITTMGRVIFHCTLCDMKFVGYDLYKLHVDDHLASEIELLDADSNEHPASPIKFEAPNEDENYTDGISFPENDSSSVEVIGDDNTSSETYFKHKNDYWIVKQSSPVYNFVTENSNDTVEPMFCDYDTEIAPQKVISNDDISPKEKIKNKRNINQSSVDLELHEMKIEAVREVEKRCFPRSQLISEEERKHKCPVCNLGFKDRHNMIHHLKRHTNKKDHKCSICGKAFYTASECRVHTRSHTKERRFLCSICGKSYVYSTQLTEHLRRHGPDKPHKCEICDKNFYDKADLTEHMVSHSWKKPFCCDECPAKFSRQGALKNHKKLHENKKEYKCRLCCFAFNQRAGLFAHIKAVHQVT